MAEYARAISFVLDNQVVTIDFNDNNALKPSTTVLNYLRSFETHKGVKEGCAEGDCGACTVVLAETDCRGNLEYKSFNSCLLFLPMLHGRQLITVENLAREVNGKQQLHPVQQAMVEAGGSQCGYCTPGFIMSLFALYKKHRNPTRETIENALTGNLCRCTGYRPIIDAAAKACAGEDHDAFTKNSEMVIDLLNSINQNKQTLELKGRDQLYLKPFTLEEALLLRKKYPEALIVNGSTDAALLQTKKNIHLPQILDISAVNDLKFTVEDHRQLAIGAGVSLQEVLEFCQTRMPVLADMLAVFGSLQIRNLATLGGNIGSASPIGDSLPVLIASESKIRLADTEGWREMTVENFITGYRKTAIRPDEIITFIIIPKPRSGEIIKSYKISKRRDLDISSVSAGFKLKINKKGIIEKALLVYGGMAEMTKRASSAELFLTGKSWTRSNAEEAARLTENEFSPISDARAEAGTRKIMARNLLIKFYEETSEV
ncbi:MAG TPA: xanthine dehydrogenase small subunit [Bacteroidales bacterium]|nr:xanthine dehydrogenase small subunit [Bacteroidales bacterium]